MASYLHRTATTEYLCCVPTLEDFSGAGRVGLAAANVQLFYYIPNFLREMLKKNSNTPSPTPLYLDLHSHTQYASADTLVIRNQYPLTADPTLPFSVGIHPWFLDNWQAQLNAIATLASHPNCWAIGECGIDKNTSTPLPLQQQIFTEQIAIAEALQKPLIIHCVKAYSRGWQDTWRQRLRPHVSYGCYTVFAKTLLLPKPFSLTVLPYLSEPPCCATQNYNKFFKPSTLITAIIFFLKQTMPN